MGMTKLLKCVLTLKYFRRIYDLKLKFVFFLVQIIFFKDVHALATKKLSGIPKSAKIKCAKSLKFGKFERKKTCSKIFLV